MLSYVTSIGSHNNHRIAAQMNVEYMRRLGTIKIFVRQLTEDKGFCYQVISIYFERSRDRSTTDITTYN